MKIVIPNTYVPERSYIIEVIFKDILGLDYDLEIKEEAQDYIIIPASQKKLIIQDSFFSKYANTSYLNQKYLPVQVSFINIFIGKNHDLVNLYGNSEVYIENEKITCGIDCFAAAFFMLTRWEEYVNKKRDEYGRFSYADSIAYKHNFLRRPIVNEYVEFIWESLVQLGINQKRKSKSFQFYNTHDIDIISLFENPLHYIAKPIKILFTQKSLSGFFHTYQLAVNALKGKDPYHTFNYLMDCSEKAGIKSWFFFMATNKTKLDKGYNPNTSFLKNIYNSIKERNHEIGFHPASTTCMDEAVFLKEKEQLESAINQKMKSGRQHFLKFEAPFTWQIWEKAGMEYSFTMSYAERVGFRAGICQAFHPFDILNRNKLDLLEIPTTVMDYTLSSPTAEALNPRESIELICSLIDKVSTYNGDFVFLWHNSSFEYYIFREHGIVYSKVLEAVEKLDFVSRDHVLENVINQEGTII